MTVSLKNKTALLLALCFTMLGSLYANVSLENSGALQQTTNTDSVTKQIENVGLSVLNKHSHFATELTEANEEEVTENVTPKKLSNNNGNFKGAFFSAQILGLPSTLLTKTHYLLHTNLGSVLKIYIKYQVLLI
ncbi:hypothetical protein JM80_0496 [Cellulophaga sp. RHA_52]|uniref:hypothetical protein n=1 Tax=Cellulophaga sp. RHA_52 TaxID=1250036 RepID=UPI001199D475|nr:hypothetical protein [Cellulophaga sp. RHA_52]TVZ08015.1 hypothetical protein JM80_0496 [Cellulophaga sp. RHA_52]